MSKIRLEKHRQLTLPVEIVAQAGLRQNDLLEVSYTDDIIIIRPIRKEEPAKPTRPIMEYVGIGKGVWGKTTEEIDANLAEDRASWERQSPLQERCAAIESMSTRSPIPCARLSPYRRHAGFL